MKVLCGLLALCLAVAAPAALADELVVKHYGNDEVPLYGGPKGALLRTVAAASLPANAPVVAVQDYQWVAIRVDGSKVWLKRRHVVLNLPLESCAAVASAAGSAAVSGASGLRC